MADADRPVSRSAAGAEVLEVVIGRAKAAAEVPGICDRIGLEMGSRDARQVVCDVGTLRDPDLLDLHLLASLQLTAIRLGGRVWLSGASPELRALLSLSGLDEAVPCVDALPLEARWESEEREEPRGIQEEDDAADPIA